MKKKILVGVSILLIAGALCLYFGEIIANGTSPMKHLFKMLAVVLLGIGNITRLLFPQKRRSSLAFYESQYPDILKNAFKDSYLDRKKLLCAIRLYNEDNYNKALKYLYDLQPRCKYREDAEAVGLFMALTYTDMTCYAEAAQVYSKMIAGGIYSTRIYSNLGHVYSKMGHYDDAIANMHLALQNDQRNPYAYQNLAALYFETYDFEKAIQYAKEALAINHKLRQAATLLAIIYSLQENREESQKYAHIAIAAGEKAADIKNAIAHYRESHQVAVVDGEEESFL